MSTSVSVVSELLGISEADFFAGPFGHAPHRTTQAVAPALLNTLPGLDDLPSLVALLSDRTGALRVSHADGLMPAQTLPNTGSVDNGVIWEAYGSGSSIVINNVQKAHAGVRTLCERLAFALSHRVWANGYISPPESAAFPTHYDDHDVIVVQLVGRKDWELYERPPCVPSFPNPRVAPAVAPEKLEASPSARMELERGSAMYVPRGTPHSVRTTNSQSFHLTIGLEAVTQADALRAAVNILELMDPDLRRPVGLDILQQVDATVDLVAAMQTLATRCLNPDLTQRVSRSLRKLLLRTINAPPDCVPSIVSRIGAAISWRSDRYHEFSTVDGAFVLSNGLRATQVPDTMTDMLDRLRRGDEVIVGSEAEALFGETLVSLGLARSRSGDAD